MTSSKRLDLQGLRGVAITTVLLFHFFPQSFPNGYIGVDMFFVLSGFLISMIFSTGPLTLATVCDFYFRRMKRILPLYLLFILSVTILASSVFRREYLQENVESAWNALLIYTNIANTSPDKAYAAMLTEASDPFTHTWSLTVEMQFYALVPIVFLTMATLGAKVVITFIASSSLVYGLVIDENVAFNSVFARFWQFHIGIAANLISNHLMKSAEAEADEGALLGDECGRVDTQKRRTRDCFLKVSLYVFLLTIIFQALYFQVIPPFLLRFVICYTSMKSGHAAMTSCKVNIRIGQYGHRMNRCSTTVITGVIILIGSGSVSSIFLLTNRFIVYLGDISYALYLVHWPIYLYMKEYQYNNINALLGILFSISLAIFLSETFEKFYLRLGRKANIFLIGILFIANVILLSSLKGQHDKMEGMGMSAEVRANYSNLTQAQVLDLNSRWTSRYVDQLSYNQCSYRVAAKKGTFPYGWCDLPVSAAHSSVPHSLMVIGNSWAANDISAVHRACKNKVSNMTLYWQAGCEVLVETTIKKMSCKKETDTFLERIREQRPDSLIILTRHFTFLQGSATVIKDAVYEEARKRLAEIEKLVRKSIILLQPIPVPHGPMDRLVRDYLKTGKNITNAQLDFLPVEVGRRRLSALAEDCKKCRTVDYMPSLSNENGEFQFFDPTLSLIYFTPGHLSPLAIHKITPVFEEACHHL